MSLMLLTAVEELNRFLTRFALTNQQAASAQTYVALSRSLAVGY